MARKTGKGESGVGQHVALSVAAHLARTKLVRDPAAVYDAQHLMTVIEIIATALARTAALYVREPKTGELRELTAAEVEGARAEKGATVLALKDGRLFSSVYIKRAELLPAIAILGMTGIAEAGIGASRGAESTTAVARAPAHEAGAKVAELEKLLAPPLLREQADAANAVAISLARNAPHGVIANLAMRLLSAVHDALHGGDENAVGVALARLRAAVEQHAEEARTSDA